MKILHMLAIVGIALLAGCATTDTIQILRTDYSLGVETHDGKMATMIRKNTALPASWTQIFSTSEDNQESVDVRILQGEHLQGSDNVLIGRFILEGIQPAPRAVPEIEVMFQISEKGELTVSAQDKETGTERTVCFSPLEQPPGNLIIGVEQHCAE